MLTPPVPAGWLRLMVKKNGLVPASPSAALVSLMLANGVPPPPQGAGGVAPLRGAGAALEKSAALWLLSTQPWSARKAARALSSAGAAPAPSKKLAPPNPTRSRISASCSGEHGVLPPLQPSDACEATRATLPEVGRAACRG